MSYGNDFEVSEDPWNELSHNTYDGEGRANLLRHKVAFTGFCERNEIHEDYIACLLFAFTLQGHALMWYVILPNASIHSFNQLFGELTSAFYHYDHQELKKKILKLQKAPDESLMKFWD